MKFNSSCDETKSWLPKRFRILLLLKAKNAEIAELKRHNDHIQEQLWKAFEKIEQYQMMQANK